MSASALKRKNKPMHDPDIVAKKVRTFHDNFDEVTRRNYSNAMKKRWNDPKSRAKLLKIMKTRKDNNGKETIKKANIISRLLPSRRKRSSSKERQQANSRLLPKLGKEIKIRHIEEERENDHCGVVIEC